MPTIDIASLALVLGGVLNFLVQRSIARMDSWTDRMEATQKDHGERLAALESWRDDCRIPEVWRG